MVEPPKAIARFGFVAVNYVGGSVSRGKRKGKGVRPSPTRPGGATHSPCGRSKKLYHAHAGSVTKNGAPRCRLHGLPFIAGHLRRFVGRLAVSSLPSPVPARESAGLPRGYCVTRMHGYCGWLLLRCELHRPFPVVSRYAAGAVVFADAFKLAHSVLISLISV
jgi:hypothetical protein